MENEKLKSQKSYIRTDKTAYTLDDIIHVRGRRKIPKPRYGLNGKALETEIRLIIFLSKRKTLYPTGLVACNMILKEYKKNYIINKHNGWRRGNMIVTKHDLNDDGTFEFDIKVLNNYAAGEYRVSLWQNEAVPYDVFDGAESQVFKIGSVTDVVVDVLRASASVP